MKLALVFVVAAAGLAQTPSESKAAIVEGRVLNALTGEPVRKAELVLTTGIGRGGGIGFDMSVGMSLDDVQIPEEFKHPPPGKTYTAQTDADGKFHMEGVDAGDYSFQVKRAGFVEQSYRPAGGKPWETLVHIAAGQELRDIEFRLTPQGAISGKVVDEDGDPVGDATVTAARLSYAGGHLSLAAGDSVPTNDRGEFRIGKLAPGRYYLLAEQAMDSMAATPAAPKDGAPEFGYVATYFPRYTDPDQAEVLDVKPAADLSAFVIHLQKSRVVRVKGTVLGPDGKPPKQTQVILGSIMRPGSMRATSAGPDGSFEFANVAPGTYTAITMHLFGNSPGNSPFTMQTLVVPNENLSDVKLTGGSQATLPGRVKVDGDSKVVLKGLAITLESEDSGGEFPAAGQAGESGSFELKNVAPTRYDVHLPNVPAGAYLKSVLWNGQEKLGQAIDLSRGLSGDLQLVLATDGGTFDARVTLDGRPVNQARVVLLPEDATRRNGQTTRSDWTDSAGHVVFHDVAPGRYLAFAWEKVDEGDWFDPVFLKASANDASRVTIGSRDNHHVDLQAIPDRAK